MTRTVVHASVTLTRWSLFFWQSISSALVSLANTGSTQRGCALGLRRSRAGFIHAFSVDRRMWEPQVVVFASRFKVVRYDLRGHGNSAAPTGPYTGYSDLRSLLDELRIEKA